MSTHYMDEAEKLFRNVILLNHGEIVLNESMDYILNKNNNENNGGASDNTAYKKEDAYNNKRLKSLEEIFMNIVKNENFKGN